MRWSVLLPLLALASVADADFRVRFDLHTTAGEEHFTLLVHEDWAPIGAARFKVADLSRDASHVADTHHRGGRAHRRRCERRREADSRRRQGKH